MRLYLFLLTACLSIQAYGQFEPATQAEDDLAYTFMNFKTAAETGNVGLAAAYTDPASLKYFESLLGFVKTAGEDTLLSADFSSWLLTMFVRFMAADGAIAAMQNGYDLYAFLLRNKMSAEFFDLFVYDIKVEGGRATVYVERNGEILNTSYYFKQDGDDWKMDFLESSRKGNAAMESLLSRPEIMEAFGNDKKKLLNQIIESSGWNKRGRNLWVPHL